MPDIVWTQGANTLTWSKGIIAGAPHRFDQTRVVSDRLAGGAVLAYEMGLPDVRQIDYTFPNVSQAKLDEFETWKESTVKGRGLTFTHTDNSKSPAFEKTVRLWDYRWTEEIYGDPAAPSYRVFVTLQVEPA